MQKDDLGGKVYDTALLRRILGYTRSSRGLVILAVLLILVVSALRLVGPVFTRKVIDIYIPNGDKPGLNRTVALYMGAIVAIFFIHYLQTYITQLIGQRLMFDLRADIFKHLQKLSLRFFDRNPVGRLMTRVTSDVEALNQMFTQGVVNIFGDIFLLIGITWVMLEMNVELALWTFIVIPMLFLITLVFKKKVRLAFRDIRRRLAEINTYLQENITGMNIVQIFNRQEKNYRDFLKINQKHTDAHVRTVAYYAIFYPTIELVSALALAIVLVRGGILRMEHLTTFGALVAFIQLAQMFFRPISDLSDKFNVLQGAIASAERVFKLLDTPPEIISPANPKLISQIEGAISFEHVSFAYNPGEWVLEDVSFEIEKGSSVAIVGHTGAGKTSLINLLGRQYDIQKGRILLDGTDIRTLSLQQLRASMAFVLQDVFLFSGTIADNIGLHNPHITRDAIIRACKDVNVHDFIMQLPDTYDTVLNERGSNLSMGQRQLISFARALVVNPQLLVLDEATANIDTETEILIQKALNFMMKDRTSIVIAHRLSTIRHVDKIFVFHKGRLKESGTHNALIKAGGLYYDLYRLQYKDQENKVAG